MTTRPNSLERFVVEAKLGGGSMGDVYRVYDRSRDGYVALKVLRKVAPDQLYLFKREFRSLAGVSHANLVTLYELLSIDGRWFITMELVDGVDFLSYVRLGPAAFDHRIVEPASTLDLRLEPVPSRKPLGPEDATRTIETRPIVPRPGDTAREAVRAPFDEPGQRARFERCVAQLVEGVRALHAAGHLHCDLKPSNVLVSRLGRVVLLDFGVVQHATANHNEVADGFIVGTPAYMAPEQAAGEPLATPADWYAVGVMIYEALTGVRPFEGTASEIVYAKRERDPPPIDGLPSPWAQLCAGLLDRHVVSRLDGDDIMAVVRPDEDRGGAVRAAELPAGEIDVELMGRERHLAILGRAFDDVRAGQLRGVLVRGTSGVGKSALCRHFVERAQRTAGALVLSGRCYEQESVPYKAVDSVIDALARYLVSLPDSELGTLVPSTSQALARLFPVLHRVEAIVALPRDLLDAADPLELRQYGFAALRGLLQRIAQLRPLILYIDDLQWADVDSAALLAEVLRPPNPPPVLVLGTIRVEHADSSPFFDALSAHLAKRAHPGAPAIELTPLDVNELSSDEARNLAVALFEREGLGPGEIRDMRANLVARESGGSPYFVRELVHFMTHARAEETTAVGARLTLARVLRARIDTLPARARRLLEIVCVAGQPISQRVAVRAAELDAGAQDAVVRLRNFRLVRTGGAGDADDIEPYHDRTRESVVAQLDGPTASARHHRLAIALEAAGEADVETLAIHYEAANELGRAADLSERAAGQAAEALAFDRAAALYRRALALRRRSPAETVALQVRLAEALAASGRGREAADAFLEAAAGSPPGMKRAYRIRAAHLLLATGFVDRGMAEMRELLVGVGASWPQTPRGVLRSLLWQRSKLWLRGFRWAQTPVSAISETDLARLDMYMIAGQTLGTIDTIRGAEFQARAVLLALQLGEPSRVARALAPEAVYAAVKVGRRRATSTRTFMAEAKMIGAETGDRELDMYLHLSEATAGYLQGRFGEPAALCASAEKALLEQRQRPIWELNNLRVIRLAALKSMGSLREYGALFEEYVGDAIRRGDLYLETTLRRFSAIIWLAADQPDEALRQLVATRWTPPGGDMHLQDWYATIGLAEIALYTGTIDQYRAELQIGVRRVARSLLIRVQTTRAWMHNIVGRLALATAVGKAGAERARSLDEAAGAARQLRKSRLGFADVWAEMIDAAVALVRGDAGQGLERLRRSLVMAEQQDMRLDLAAGQRALGEHLGGAEGDALIAMADAWMMEERIVVPARMTEFMVPGLRPVEPGSA